MQLQLRLSGYFEATNGFLLDDTSKKTLNKLEPLIDGDKVVFVCDLLLSLNRPTSKLTEYAQLLHINVPSTISTKKELADTLGGERLQVRLAVSRQAMYGCHLPEWGPNAQYQLYGFKRSVSINITVIAHTIPNVVDTLKSMSFFDLLKLNTQTPTDYVNKEALLGDLSNYLGLSAETNA